MADSAPYLNASVEATKVEYRQLGQSGLRVSVPIYGTMSLGDRRNMPWAVEEEEVRHFAFILSKVLVTVPIFSFKDSSETRSTNTH